MFLHAVWSMRGNIVLSLIPSVFRPIIRQMAICFFLPPKCGLQNLGFNMDLCHPTIELSTDPADSRVVQVQRPGQVSTPTHIRSTRRRRSVTPIAQSPASDEGISGPTKKCHKVSRACDFCKARKAKCSGTIPCDKCGRKGLTCRYDAKYSRGRPRTPPLSATYAPLATGDRGSDSASPQSPNQKSPQYRSNFILETQQEPAPPGVQASSRASPELDLAEIQGQVFDPTSGVSFLHRAWKRLARHDGNIVSDQATAHTDDQPWTFAGDKPLPRADDSSFSLEDRKETKELMDLYFDVCIATYRILHRPTVERWLDAIYNNLRDGKSPWRDIGRARTAIVLTALAIATAHREKSRQIFSPEDEALSLNCSDELFRISSRLTDEETGIPRLESAQARLIQVLYLLTTSRMNRAWYVFGNALQIISALGLHRRSDRKRQRSKSKPDYIQSQCRMRTFWTAYILDKYLGVIFGRPRHFHDDDIDQDFPDRVNDEDMTSQGPIDHEENDSDCHIDALVFHAKY
jgi:hypothetical protein